MPYVLVSVTSEGATLLTAEPYATRDAAMTALREMLAGPAADVIRAGETRLLDLDAAAPIMIVEPPVPVLGPEVETDEVGQGEPTEDPEPGPEPEPEPAVILDDAVEQDDFEEKAPVDDTVVAPAADDVDEAVVVEVPEAPEVVEDDMPPVPPIALTEAPSPIEDSLIQDVPDAPSAEADQSLVDALQAAAQQLLADGVPEPADVGEPVSGAGAHTDTDTGVVDPAGAVPAVSDVAADERRSWPWELESDDDAITDGPDEPTAAPAVIDEGDGAAAGDVPLAGSTPEPPAVIEDDLLPEDPPKAYEPGALDMETYTCDDCVYESTCPKKGDDAPATCGSFQWKSS